MFLLDTNVVSEMRKIRSGKANARVAAWADSVDTNDLYRSLKSALCLPNAVTPRREPCSAHGWTITSCQRSMAVFWPSTLPLPGAAPGCTYLTRARCAERGHDQPAPEYEFDQRIAW